MTWDEKRCRNGRLMIKRKRPKEQGGRGNERGN
jgi:hypothetical protein